MPNPKPRHVPAQRSLSVHTTIFISTAANSSPVYVVVNFHIFNMTDKTLDLCVSNYGTAKSLDYALAVLPWGATEPHNLHLPYLTDAILSNDVAVDAATIALEKYGVRAMVLAPVAMGAQNPGQRGAVAHVLAGRVQPYPGPAVAQRVADLLLVFPYAGIYSQSCDYNSPVHIPVYE